jgi:hypothetical protein
MNRNASRFIDDNHIFILMNDLYRVLSDRRFMAVQGMRDEVTVAKNIIGSDAATVDEDCSPYHRLPIVVERSIPKLRFIDLKKGSVTPSLLAVGVVSVVVWHYPTQPIAFKVVGSGPRISHRGDKGLIRIRDLGRILLLLLLGPSRVLLLLFIVVIVVGSGCGGC